MNSAGPFGIKPADGCIPIMFGILAGVFGFVAISFVNFSVTLGEVNAAGSRCQDMLVPGIIELVLSIACAFIAWLAIFGRRPFRNAFAWVRLGITITAILLLVPWPCSFSGSGAMMFANCARPSGVTTR